MQVDDIFDTKKENLIEKTIRQIIKIYRHKLDKYIIYQKQRWCITGLLLLLYIIRIWKIGGFYVVSYIMSLYVLQQAVAFFTPIGVPDAEDEDEEDNNLFAGNLPSFESDVLEDRGPLIRQISEFKFWQIATFTFALALFSTTSEVFNIPVYWPFLLFYFFLLFFLTIKRQFRHMKKWKYSMDDFMRKSNK